MADTAAHACRPGRSMRRRAILAATIGNALEFYDFITYGFFAIQIGHTFFPSHNGYISLMLSLATFGAGFITRPIGGIVLGTYADRVGRRPAMMLSFTLMGAAIITIALIPSYATIGIAAPILAVLARMAQGFSLGGEVGPTTAYLMESAPPNGRGFAVSWQGASQGISATVAGLVGFGLSVWMPCRARLLWLAHRVPARRCDAAPSACGSAAACRRRCMRQKRTWRPKHRMGFVPSATMRASSSWP